MRIAVRLAVNGGGCNEQQLQQVVNTHSHEYSEQRLQLALLTSSANSVSGIVGSKNCVRMSQLNSINRTCQQRLRQRITWAN